MRISRRQGKLIILTILFHTKKVVAFNLGESFKGRLEVICVTQIACYAICYASCYARRELHPEKEKRPIFEMLSSGMITIDSRAMHPEKAKWPIVVTLL
jgi:hypothetical protein